MEATRVITTQKVGVISLVAMFYTPCTLYFRDEILHIQKNMLTFVS